MPTGSAPPAIMPCRKPASRNCMQAAVLLVFLGMAAGSARADIYMYVGADGTQHFSNVPTDSRYVLAMRTGSHCRHAAPGKSGINQTGRNKLNLQIQRAASQYHVDPALLHAVITTESGYRPRAVSNKGAMGLMQLMPATARRYGARNAFDPDQNILAGTEYLHKLLTRFDGKLRLALAAYNAGTKAVLKYGGVPPFPETEAYVPKVIGWYRHYRNEAGLRGNVSGM